MTITPAILPLSFEHLVSDLFKLEGLCNRVQIDICDGVFGLEKTWLPYQEKELPHGFSYEFDIMVRDWRKYLPRVIALGATRVVMHIDSSSDEDIRDMVALASKHKVSIGLAVSNDYDINNFTHKANIVADYYHKMFIQVMGIKRIGAQGQPFDDSVVRRIEYIKRECRNVSIQVDGSMNPETIFLVKRAGATCAVVGSFLFGHSDVKKQLEKLQKNFL
jgi:ribulose-phosphate 3-epimerase